MRTVIAIMGESNTVTQDSLDYNYASNQYQSQTFTYYTGRLAIAVNHKFNAKHVLKTGFTISQLGFDLFYKNFNFSTNQAYTYINQNGNTHTLQSFLQWKHNINEDWSLVNGLHAIHFLLNGNTSIEPRIALRWQWHPLHAINLGAGLHSRMETISNYMLDIPKPDGTTAKINKHMDFTKAVHFIGGYDYQITEHLRLKADIYYQHLFNVPVENLDTSIISALNFNEGLANIPLVNEGLGKNYGVEITLERFLKKNFYYLITASVFESYYQAKDRKWRNTAFNNNYVFNILSGKDVKFGQHKQHTFGINIKAILKGGNRVIPIDEACSSQTGETTYNYKNAYHKKVQDYWRLDAGLKYRNDRSAYVWLITLDLQNATNRQNIYGIYFDGFKKQIQYTYHLGLVPVLNLRLEF